MSRLYFFHAFVLHICSKKCRFFAKNSQISVYFLQIYNKIYIQIKLIYSNKQRELRKNKDLVRELYPIIFKYLPDLLKVFDKLTDIKNQSYIIYKMRTICVTTLFLLLCRITSTTDISANSLNTNECIHNLSKICNQNLEELPFFGKTTRCFANVYTDKLEYIQKYIVKTLICSKNV